MVKKEPIEKDFYIEKLNMNKPYKSNLDFAHHKLNRKPKIEVFNSKSLKVHELLWRPRSF